MSKASQDCAVLTRLKTKQIKTAHRKARYGNQIPDPPPIPSSYKADIKFTAHFPSVYKPSFTFHNCFSPRHKYSYILDASNTHRKTWKTNAWVRMATNGQEQVTQGVIMPHFLISRHDKILSATY